MKIFIVNGRGGAGKTSFEKMIVEIAAAHNQKIAVLSTIDYVKDIAKSIGWDGTKTLENRRMLSDLKDLLTRWNDSPHQSVCNKIKELNDVEAIGMTIDNRRLRTSPPNGRGEYTNYFSKADIRYYNDMSENGLVFTVTDNPVTAGA